MKHAVQQQEPPLTCMPGSKPRGHDSLADERHPAPHNGCHAGLKAVVVQLELTRHQPAQGTHRDGLHDTTCKGEVNAVRSHLPRPNTAASKLHPRLWTDVMLTGIRKATD